jgi:hypothetical protein
MDHAHPTSPHLIKRETVGDRLQHPLHHEAPPARIRPLPWLLVLVLLALSAWLAWRAFGPEDNGDPLATSLVAFEKQNRLTVFSAQLSPVVASEDSRLMGLVHFAPGRGDPGAGRLHARPSRMDRNRLRWDEATSTLDVQLPGAHRRPAPTSTRAAAQYLREGIWISRDAQDNLTAEHPPRRAAGAGAGGQPGAARPRPLAAKDAIRQNLAIPLEVAGSARSPSTCASTARPCPR